VDLAVVDEDTRRRGFEGVGAEGPPPERLADGDGGEEWARFLAPGAAAGVVPK
jgi:hypothetical protein